MRVFVLPPEDPHLRNQELRELAGDDAPAPERRLATGNDGREFSFTRFVTEATTGERIAIYVMGNSRDLLDRWLEAHAEDLPAPGLRIIYGGSVSPP